MTKDLHQTHDRIMHSLKGTRYKMTPGQAPGVWSVGVIDSTGEIVASKTVTWQPDSGTWISAAHDQTFRDSDSIADSMAWAVTS